jgi:hypothetical protein
MSSRPTPFDLVFVPLADERFPAIRAALLATGQDSRDRDIFLMVREAALLLHELRPDDGIGEGIDRLAALVHHAYLFWAAGSPATVLGPEELGRLLAGASSPAREREAEAAGAQYVQVPERRVWAKPVQGEPFEPLDGCFLSPAPDGRLRVLAVFGLRPDRAGFTVVEAQGAHPVGLARPDGTALFAPTLAGDTQAGLSTLVGAEELLELGWRMLGRPAGTADPRGDG